MMNDFDELIQNPVSRRAFLQRMTAAGLGTAAAAFLAGCGGGGSSYPGNSGLSGTGTSGGTNGGGTGTNGTGTNGIANNGDGTGTNGGTTPTFFDNTNFPNIPGRSYDEVVLNFALTLEILEADLYRQALNIASGRALSTPLDTTLPTPNSTGNYTQVVSTGAISDSGLARAGFLYLVQYAYVEAAHRDFLSATLASLGAPVQQPNAKGYTTNLATNSDLATILQTILVVEETGVRAYEGGANYMSLSNPAQLLTTAVAIHSTEARHSAAISYILGLVPEPRYTPSLGDKNVYNRTNNPNPAPYLENTFQYYLDPVTVLNDVQPFIVK